MPRPHHDQAWHRSIAKLIDKLKCPDFWDVLVRQLSAHATIDNWAVLIFSDKEVRAVSYPETADESEIDAFLNQYIKGLYILDPFYIANRENAQNGLVHLLDIAPTRFFETDYYNLYFEQYISVDEIQYNVQLEKNKTLCLSIGSKKRFTPEQVFIFELVQPWVTALIYQRMDFESQAKIKPVTKNWQDIISELSSGLTLREIEVVKLLLSGYSNNEIASRLLVSSETVKVHRRNIYAKLNIKSQSELFAFFFHSTLQ
ncbi:MULTISPECIES: helix-turn-helix domain-containing protein [Pseudomonas syringae group]|uniref:LuxR family transcriptional regulator n=1 Tax=Pseudomonas syringae pv. persicae TaxID=237306 RepID=A0AB38EPI0_9PSED|nr:MULTISPECIES: helix-turn-helix transcriptional regulator [Pseudomonas syringae group]RMR74297.1 hypothetical protein ALP80_200176 [Pseudomonas savastanoi pv. fraxini]SOQ16125.1 LuxR family transcriptional regulator [Pseudomonas syringae pv. persicae]SOQ16280.1 LuxR family transcriptional regulator [Pseudomonas syringae pv. persicae]